MAAEAADEPRPVSVWVFLVISLAIAGAVLLGLRLAVGVRLDAPTLALAVACAVMIWALRGMWGIVAALARPGVDIIVDEGAAAVAHSSTAELREEKRRVLRAIKELEFDHGMGKLSDEDFKAISERYKLRAIEVMRELDGSDGLHPLLTEHLEQLRGSARPVPPVDAAAPDADADTRPGESAADAIADSASAEPTTSDGANPSTDAAAPADSAEGVG